MIIKTGERLGSVVDGTEIIVVRAAPGEVELTCGGASMRPLGEIGERTGQAPPGLDAGTQMGKRYTRAAGDLELLVTKAGSGSLAADGEVLTVKQAKPLPASD
jgi:hypothetical protein